PLYFRLSFQAVDRSADRDRGRDPRLYGRSHRGERPWPAHPLSPQDQFGAMVEQRQSLDDRGSSGRHWEVGPLHRKFPLDVPGILSALTGLYARMAGDGRVQGPNRSPADMAKRP